MIKPQLAVFIQWVLLGKEIKNVIPHKQACSSKWFIAKRFCEVSEIDCLVQLNINDNYLVGMQRCEQPKDCHGSPC